VQVRIISIADIYDALTAQDRPYKKAMPAEVALKILKEEAAGGKLDQELLDLFIKEEVYKLSDDPAHVGE
jgi:HD-GYP domain-containing protein (c-di-GMP phosphodiesterase class II)